MCEKINFLFYLDLTNLQGQHRHLLNEILKQRWNYDLFMFVALGEILTIHCNPLYNSKLRLEETFWYSTEITIFNLPTASENVL